MRRVRYLCLDDEKTLVRKLVARIDQQAPNLSIETRPPKPFEEELAAIQDAHRQKKLDGLLIDLRLDESAPEGTKPVRYTATGLAAQLRSWLSTRKQDVVGFPIVLWSVESRMEYAFRADASNKDLFDLIFEKEQFPKESVRAAKQLVGLVDAYRCIASSLDKARNFFELLRPAPNIDLDERIGIQFANAFKSQPTHRYAQFIFTQLIDRPGVLIDERVLCARLGVDFDSPGKVILLKKLSTTCRYKGPFANAWPRWWREAVDAWWRKISDGKVLSRLSAADRVDLLKRALKIARLKVAQPFAKGYSTYFSTICSHTNRPIDSIDGFVMSESHPQPWQTRRYVARDVALDPAAYDFRQKIDPIEADRLKALREKLRSHGKKGRTAKSARN